jgi:hypothetical protein
MVGVLFHIGNIEWPRDYFNKIRIESVALDATDIIFVDQSQYHISRYFSSEELNVHRFTDIEQAETQFVDYNFVYLESPGNVPEENSASLHVFMHPKDPIYVAGPNTGTLVYAGREDQHWVHIPIKDGGILYAETAIAMALYDRKLKLNGGIGN